MHQAVGAMILYRYGEARVGVSPYRLNLSSDDIFSRDFYCSHSHKRQIQKRQQGIKDLLLSIGLWISCLEAEGHSVRRNVFEARNFGNAALK